MAIWFLRQCDITITCIIMLYQFKSLRTLPIERNKNIYRNIVSSVVYNFELTTYPGPELIEKNDISQEISKNQENKNDFKLETIIKKEQDIEKHIYHDKKYEDGINGYFDTNTSGSASVTITTHNIDSNIPKAIELLQFSNNVTNKAKNIYSELKTKSNDIDFINSEEDSNLKSVTKKYIYNKPSIKNIDESYTVNSEYITSINDIDELANDIYTKEITSINNEIRGTEIWPVTVPILIFLLILLLISMKRNIVVMISDVIKIKRRFY